MRLFVAINFDPQLREAVFASTEALCPLLPGSRWIPASRLHLTVKFLGERSSDFATSLIGRLDGLAASYEPFTVDIGGIGCFPNPMRPKVVWMGVSPEPVLEFLHHDTELCCAELGAAVEGRPFRPHITVARVRERSARPARGFLAACEGVNFTERVSVNSLDVMESVSEKGIVRYTVLHSSNFARTRR